MCGFVCPSRSLQSMRSKTQPINDHISAVFFYVSPVAVAGWWEHLLVQGGWTLGYLSRDEQR